MQKQQEQQTKNYKKINVYGPCATEFVSSNTGSWRIERPIVDFENCIKCGTCERFCPCNVITIHKDIKECVEIDYDYCKGCGICVNECPKNCMKLIPEGSVE